MHLLLDVSIWFGGLQIGEADTALSAKGLVAPNLIEPVNQHRAGIRTFSSAIYGMVSGSYSSFASSSLSTFL